ncbi:hypothetical protein CK203_026780 [Vitis vinifera]|uniref:DUF4283 domain-containing protein n=1 Tax=Vitis vinifera TaxID=29760 RepID=A0A438IPA1_VITVI|nr:hypothetical protein CK203_026780 [Vitis vinifera]
MRPEDISCAQFFQQKRKKLGSYGVVLPFKATEVLNAGASPSQMIQPLGPKVLGTFAEEVEYACGGFLGVHETPRGKNLQWARVLIKTNRRKVLGSLQVAVGQSCPAVHLCWELPLLGPQMCPCKEWLEEKAAAGGIGDSRGWVGRRQPCFCSRGAVLKEGMMEVVSPSLELGLGCGMKRNEIGFSAVDDALMRNRANNVSFEYETRAGEEEERSILARGCALESPMRDSIMHESSFSKLASFNKFVGLLVDGFEEDIMALLQRLELRKKGKVLSQVLRSILVGSKFEMEHCIWDAKERKRSLTIEEREVRRGWGGWGG